MRRFRHISIHTPNPWSKILPVLRHLLPAVTTPLILGAALPTTAHAQLLNDILHEESSIDSLPEKTLRLDIDAIGFFRDNEYETEIQNGYSLPGVRLNPHFAYNPIQNINIEAGASMLFFNGANKYPSYVYHDIGTWKGNQYQSGAHVLPWIRLQASFKHLDIVIGNLYGAGNHNLITPLFNHEQNISADPEMGFQLLLHRPHVNMDVWMNWQSYIFETDTHQEAFTVGATTKLLWGKDNSNSYFEPKALSLYTPIQLVIQHRGGEQDKTNRGVQTIANASIGMGARWEPSKTNGNISTSHSRNIFNSMDVLFNAIGCYQQSGKLWPFESGLAWHAGLNTKWFNHLTFSMDYMRAANQFVSLYGNPFYSTISLKHGGTTITADDTLIGIYNHQYKGMNNLRIGIDYQYTFAKSYTLGADAEFFSVNSKECCLHNEKLSDISFSFGIYLRISPSILLRKF